MGSIAHLTLLRMLQVSPLPGMDRFDSDAPYSITFTAEPGRRQQHLAALKRFIDTHGYEITRNQVDAPPVLSKFDEFIPESLLRKAYDTDRLDLDDLREAASRWT
jgi:ATP-dependent Lhr-like helicase